MTRAWSSSLMQIKATSPRISTCSVPVTTCSHKPTSAISIMIYERGRTKFRLIIYPNEKVETSQLQRGLQNRVIFPQQSKRTRLREKLSQVRTIKKCLLFSWMSMVFYVGQLAILASCVAQMVKNLPAMWKTWVWSLGLEDPLEKGMATHSSILAWRIPWTEEPGGLQSMGSQSWIWLSD